ncbi:MAG: exodeoxyribonuclease III [Candidatus Vogelbacteria bacterium CG10_big_fil_rev_8_21_14_0_10_45_14]|uniref:Exodeoxyribonuclease III n=1 Tax=Candidatus Vogelbacteria bacterium CG10_big_fil_rev_8_21_14_0_10_45_14 TaxID=1975042 RepID=A0A2H0RKP4_9BACT|nr:MAG: exodeoxyribonuclease III [Candidatus Vogelbacteria bacterium CG10_big_fil_rev_8_21_14_0_10_45_14]
MKFLSWNVNGVRAVHRKGELLSWIKGEKADFYCLQETKAHREQLGDEILNIKGYTSLWNAPSNGKRGYSGVAIYAKETPQKIEDALDVADCDGEGRLLILHYPKFILVNCYFPKSDTYGARFDYKMSFYDAFLKKMEKMRRMGKSIIFCGDVNVAHEPIDLARPVPNEKSPGYLPEERGWVDEVIDAGYVDTFRHLYPAKKEAYTWWDMVTRARDRNVGWRIDYFFISQDLLPHLKTATIYSEKYGSDHCPTGITLNI